MESQHRRFSVIVIIAGVFATVAAPSAWAQQAQTVVDIGSRRELFVDEFLIESLKGEARQLLHHPTPREIVLVGDRPW